MGHEQLTEIGTSIRAHGAPDLAKVRTTSYAVCGVKNAEVIALYNSGEFVVSHRCMFGSAEALAKAVREAGYIVRGIRTAHDSHAVIFDTAE